MKKSVIGSIVGAVVIIGGVTYYFGVSAPHAAAVKDFNSAKSALEVKNNPLETSIAQANELINSKSEALETKTKADELSALTNAKKALVEIPTLPKKTSDIKSATVSLKKSVDYSNVLSELNSANLAYSKSIEDYQKLTNPSSSTVIAALKTIPTITDVQAATESNDPNESLNKQGGYTADIYFTDNQVDSSQIYAEGTGAVALGTKGGGSVEVYKTASDAQKRDAYLGAFDGVDFLNFGSHKTYGTCVIRTSGYLPASQQSSLEKQIVQALIK